MSGEMVQQRARDRLLEHAATISTVDLRTIVAPKGVWACLPHGEPVFHNEERAPHNLPCGTFKHY